MTGNNPNLHLVNMNALSNLVIICLFVFKILSGSEILTSIKCIALLQINQNDRSSNNLNRELVIMNARAKFGENLSICSQDIERKRNSYVN